ncbi:hypothetical protein C0Q70_16840 [Pomacea canaliculata]|uniref:ZP domain-containing protein n=1 Tax=Pomacea canaliculata TaxID=400727 RepID=A0A2T7NQY0_POMCA|nr:hypothetical protein C0Q70_16840 [Pomacea canaliculata]
MAPAAWLSLLLLVLTAQDTADAQTPFTPSTYQTAVSFSDGIEVRIVITVAFIGADPVTCSRIFILDNRSDSRATNGIYECDDVVSPRYACPNTSWTLLPASDGPMCLQLVDTLDSSYGARQSCWNMGGRLLTITSEARQRAVEICVDGFVGDNCDQACHCYGELCKGGQPCKYGCEAGWTGPYCYTRTRKAEVIYYCVNNTAEGRYALTVQLTDEAASPPSLCSAPRCVRRHRRLLRQDPRHPGQRGASGLDLWWQPGTYTRESDQPNNGLPSVEKPLNSREFVSLVVTDSFTGQTLTRARLGANVQLRMTLSTSRVSSLRAQGVSPYNCVASSGDGLYQLVLTDSDGKTCPAGGSTVISELWGHNGTVKSDPFQLFAFAGQNTLQIVCSFQFCFSREDVFCTDRCNARRMALLTTTNYGDTSTYNYWTSTTYWYRKKREANSTEFATAVVTEVTEQVPTPLDSQEVCGCNDCPQVWLPPGSFLVLAGTGRGPAQTFDINATYQVAVNFSQGIVASGIYECDDVVSPRYACPNTNWTLVLASDGPICLQLVDILEMYDNANQSCGNMGESTSDYHVQNHARELSRREEGRGHLLLRQQHGGRVATRW